MQPVFLITDMFIAAVLAWVIFYVQRIRRDRHLAANWRLALRRPMAMASAGVLLVFVVIAVLDSVHFRLALPALDGQPTRYSAEVISLLDKALQPLAPSRSKVSLRKPVAAKGAE